jgi:hypothetical protein
MYEKNNNQVTPYGGQQGAYKNSREATHELTRIKNVQDVEIDHEVVLAIKRGDLSIMQGEVYKCIPRSPHL